MRRFVFVGRVIKGGKYYNCPLICCWQLPRVHTAHCYFIWSILYKNVKTGLFRYVSKNKEHKLEIIVDQG